MSQLSKPQITKRKTLEEIKKIENEIIEQGIKVKICGKFVQKGSNEHLSKLTNQNADTHKSYNKPVKRAHCVLS